ncbi:hypothetical protein QFC21_007046 [Naganishia friedmannii]|uniref:Uncharacterized protein n=1 Tax=Naganishia friedmannii TaxID=89922 RepID=A0ACC2UYL8_9TREE|nr:hypothetical protein QFC21_007046 [Naganishia friedmannii]
MGGIWGQASNTALENIPVQARGLISGFLQQGYAVGYLFAAVVNLYLVPKVPEKHAWQSLYWVGCGLSVFAAIFRAILPESEMFRRAREEAKSNPPPAGQGKQFLRELRTMLKVNWKRAIWAVLLGRNSFAGYRMTGFNLSHGSQDLYPTYLQKTKLLSGPLSSKATIIANCGAIVGGIIAGYASQYTGRRLAIIGMLLFIACFIPLWIIPSTFGPLSAGAFFVQFGVQGAWGCVPIYLAESSPSAFRASFSGVAYQLGNMISSAAAQIEAKAGETLRVTVHGKNLPDYAKVQGILIGVVIIWTLFFVLIGPEAHGAHFEDAKVAFESGAGKDVPEAHLETFPGHSEQEEGQYDSKKTELEQVERI